MSESQPVELTATDNQMKDLIAFSISPPKWASRRLPGPQISASLTALNNTLPISQVQPAQNPAAGPPADSCREALRVAPPPPGPPPWAAKPLGGTTKKPLKRQKPTPPKPAERPAPPAPSQWVAKPLEGATRAPPTHLKPRPPQMAEAPATIPPPEYFAERLRASAVQVDYLYPSVYAGEHEQQTTTGELEKSQDRQSHNASTQAADESTSTPATPSSERKRLPRRKIRHPATGPRIYCQCIPGGLCRDESCACQKAGLKCDTRCQPSISGLHTCTNQWRWPDKKNGCYCVEGGCKDPLVCVCLRAGRVCRQGMCLGLSIHQERFGCENMQAQEKTPIIEVSDAADGGDVVARSEKNSVHMDTFGARNTFSAVETGTVEKKWASMYAGIRDGSWAAFKNSAVANTSVAARARETKGEKKSSDEKQMEGNVEKAVNSEGTKEDPIPISEDESVEEIKEVNGGRDGGR